jgi:hypothetical protein
VVQEFLQSTATGLEEIMLEGPYAALAPIILQDHAHTLKTLGFHDPERSIEKEETQRSALPYKDVLGLATKCRLLENLELDVDLVKGKTETLSVRYSHGFRSQMAYIFAFF